MMQQPHGGSCITTCACGPWAANTSCREEAESCCWQRASLWKVLGFINTLFKTYLNNSLLFQVCECVYLTHFSLHCCQYSSHPLKGKHQRYSLKHPAIAALLRLAPVFLYGFNISFYMFYSPWLCLTRTPKIQREPPSKLLPVRQKSKPLDTNE